MSSFAGMSDDLDPVTKAGDNFEFLLTPAGWFCTYCPPWSVDLAKERHERLKKQYAHFDKYIEQTAGGEGNDMRWSGRLGEIVLDAFLTSNNIPHTWEPERNPLDDNDFTIRGLLTDLKTKNVGSFPKLTETYFATVAADQHARVDEKGTFMYLFCSYNWKDSHMIILGGMSVEKFKKTAIHRDVGDVVHKDYTVRYESWDVLLSSLIKPSGWL